MPVLTREQSRELDRRALTEYGLPALVLMENAARSVCAFALEMLGTRAADTHPTRIVIACGPGNNGGDGLAAARHLRIAGADVRIVLLDERCAGDCAQHLRVARAMRQPIQVWAESGTIEPCDLLIDALFGTGLSRPLDTRATSLVRAINDSRSRTSVVRTLAVDVPTGLDADTGNPVGGSDEPVVRADATITLCTAKPGLLAPHAERFVGELRVGEIGVPRELIESVANPL
jgi:NAD(P)H-hydrate epimerase